MITRALILVGVVAGILGLLIWSQHRHEPSRVSGYVETDDIRLGSRVGGRVRRVLVEEGDHVSAGQKLVELEPFDINFLLAQAQGLLAQRRAELDKLQAGYRPEDVAQAQARRDELAAKVEELTVGPRPETIAAARARVAQAQANATYARQSLEKFQQSFERGVATREELDKATQALQAGEAVLNMYGAELAELEAGTRQEDLLIAKAQLEQAEQALRLAKTGYRQEEIAAARAAVAAAESAVQVVEAQAVELTIVAPVDAVVDACNLRPGDLVAPEAPALTLLTKDSLYVRAFVPEPMLTVQPGMRVLVGSDAHGDRRFAGHVTFVSRQAEFMPSNVQTTEKRGEQVFRIKVVLDEGLDVLRPGVPVDVYLQGEAKK